MFIKRRQLLVAVAALPAVALAQTARPLQEMKDFRPVTPPQPGRIRQQDRSSRIFSVLVPALHVV